MENNGKGSQEVFERGVWKQVGAPNSLNPSCLIVRQQSVIVRFCGQLDMKNLSQCHKRWQLHFMARKPQCKTLCQEARLISFSVPLERQSWVHCTGSLAFAGKESKHLAPRGGVPQPEVICIADCNKPRGKYLSCNQPWAEYLSYAPLECSQRHRANVKGE